MLRPRHCLVTVGQAVQKANETGWNKTTLHTGGEENNLQLYTAVLLPPAFSVPALLKKRKCCQAGFPTSFYIFTYRKQFSIAANVPVVRPKTA